MKGIIVRMTRTGRGRKKKGRAGTLYSRRTGLYSVDGGGEVGNLVAGKASAGFRFGVNPDSQSHPGPLHGETGSAATNRGEVAARGGTVLGPSTRENSMGTQREDHSIPGMDKNSGMIVIHTGKGQGPELTLKRRMTIRGKGKG